MKAKHKSWFPNHEHCLPNHDHGLSNQPWSWYAQNYMRSVPVFLFLAHTTWTTLQTSPWVTNLLSYHNAWLLTLKRKYKEQIKLSLSLGDWTWTSTLGTRFVVVVACWRSGAIAAAIDCAIRCHFLIIHGGSFGYKMFSILRALKMHGRQPHSAHLEFPRHAMPLEPIYNIIPLRI
jgi:hypothetical protein